MFFDLLIIYESSSQLRSGQDNVRKCVSIPNCLNIASTSYKNCFEYAGVLLTEIINENALPLAIVPAVILPGLILCIAMFIDKRKWYCSYRYLAKNT